MRMRPAAILLGLLGLFAAAAAINALVGLARSAHAATTLPEVAVVEHIAIPSASYLYRLKLVREVVHRFADDRPVARIAAQMHQESLWRADARSRYANGLAQFTPATAEWLPTICPEIGAPDPWSPTWSVRAAVCYDAWLHARVNDAATDCDRWAMTLAGYNGGERWRQRDQGLARAAGADPAVWFGSVENYSARAAWAIRENRAYVRRILRTLEPVYIAAGWPGQAVCA